MDEDKVARIKRRLEALRGAREMHESEWADCFRYTFPERMAGFQGTDQTSYNAKAQRAEIYDDTAKDAARILASSFASGLTPANSIWFGLDADGPENDEEQRWLGEAAQFIFDNINAANFDAASFECHVDMAAGPGMFVLYTEEAKEGGYRFEQFPFSQCFVAASRSGGRVDTLYRDFELTVEQLVVEYGEKNVSESTQRKYANGKYDDKQRVVWAMEPRRASEEGHLSKHKPFSSCHIEVEGSTLLRESGYDEFPCCVPRWLLIPGTHYGTGPMSTALATVKTLNEVKKLEITNLEMAAYGMYKATDDGVMNPSATRIGPRRIIVVADMNNFERIEPSGDFKVSMMKADEMQAAIRKLMLADQLQPQDGPAMTATEVHARISLIRQQLGPIFGRLQAEWLRPLIERCFGLAFRAGALEAYCGPIPQSLRGKTINVHYQSPLARAQKLEEVSAIDQWVGSIVQYAATTQDTTVLDEVDTVAIARFKRDALGVPSLAQRTPEDVQKLRDDRQTARDAQAKAQSQQQIQTEAGGAVAKQLATAGA